MGEGGEAGVDDGGAGGPASSDSGDLPLPLVAATAAAAPAAGAAALADEPLIHDHREDDEGVDWVVDVVAAADAADSFFFAALSVFCFLSVESLTDLSVFLGDADPARGELGGVALGAAPAAVAAGGGGGRLR